MTELATEIRKIKSKLEVEKQRAFQELRSRQRMEGRKIDLPISRPRDLGIPKAMAAVESQAKQVVEAAEQIKEETIVTEITTEKTGEELFAEAKTAGTIPANATYTSYNQETGELSYSVPVPAPTGREAFRIGQEKGLIPKDAYYLGWDEKMGQVSYSIPFTTSEILNTLYKFGIRGDVKVENYDVGSGEVRYAYEPFYWNAVMVSGKTYVIAANTIEEARQAAKALGSVAYVHLTFSVTPEQKAAAIGATPRKSGTINLGNMLDAYKAEGGYNVAKMFADGWTIEQLTEVGFDKTALEQVQTELATFETENVKLETGEYIPRTEYDSLTTEQQDFLREHGVEEFNKRPEEEGELLVEIETGKGKITMPLNEWEAMSEIKRFETVLGRPPTLEEWRNYRLQEAGVDLPWYQEVMPGAAQAVAMGSLVVGGQHQPELEEWLKIQVSAQEEWQRAYPELKWGGAFISSAEQLGFPATRAFYPQIAVKDITGTEWAVTGGSVALWTMSAWLPKAVAGVKKVAGIKLTTKTPIIKLQKPITVTDLGLFGKKVAVRSPVKVAWGAGLQRAGLSAQVETIAFNAGKAATELKAATSVARTSTEAVLPPATASRLKIAQMNALSADTKFIEILNGLKLDVKQIKLLEKATGYKGLEIPIREVGAAAKKLNSAWYTAEAANNMYGLGSRSSLEVMENVTRARTNLGRAVDKLDDILKPRYTEGAAAGYDPFILQVEKYISELKFEISALERNLKVAPTESAKYTYGHELKTARTELASWEQTTAVLKSMEKAGIPIPQSFSRTSVKSLISRAAEGRWTEEQWIRNLQEEPVFKDTFRFFYPSESGNYPAKPIEPSSPSLGEGYGSRGTMTKEFYEQQQQRMVESWAAPKPWETPRATPAAIAERPVTATTRNIGNLQVLRKTKVTYPTISPMPQAATETAVKGAPALGLQAKLASIPEFSAEKAFSGMIPMPLSMEAIMPEVVPATTVQPITELAITEEQLTGTVPLTQGQTRIITEATGKTQEQVSEMIKTGELAHLLSLPVIQTNVHNQINSLTETELENLTKQLTELQPQVQTATQLQTQVQVPAQLQTQIQTPTEMRTEVKPKPIPFLSVPGGEGADEEGKVYPNGTTVWKMGMWWKIIPPDWGLRKPISSRYAPAGVTKLHGTPQETLTFIGGEIPYKNVAFDLGVTDGYINVKEQKIYFSGNGESTNVGQSLPSNTQGITLLESETEEMPMMKPKQFAEKLHLRPVPQPTRRNAYRSLVRKAASGERVSRDELREAWRT